MKAALTIRSTTCKSINAASNLLAREKTLKTVLYIIFPILLALATGLSSSVIDPFHEGEYLGNYLYIRDYYRGLAEFPILIHGAMDYLPALVASEIKDGKSIIFYTRLFNTMAICICWIAWMDMARIILKRSDSRYILGLLFILMFIVMSTAVGNTPVNRQQAFLGTRDVFLIVSLWCSVKSIDYKNGIMPGLLVALTGFFSAASFYWSYDRGIMSAVLVISLSTVYVLGKGRRNALLLVTSYGASILAISATGIAGTLVENISNVKYWIFNTGDVWFLAQKLKRDTHLGSLATLIFAATVIWYSARRTLRSGIDELTPVRFALVVIQLLFLLKMKSLPAFPVNYYFVWPSILLLVLLFPKSSVLNTLNLAVKETVERVTQQKDQRSTAEIFKTACLLSIVILFSSNLFISSMKNIVQSIKPVPDELLLSRKQYGLDNFSSYTAPCIFQWSNEGIFSFAARKPYCSKYAYAVYIASNQEQHALQELKAKPPELVVYNSPYWSMRIYERTMKDRLPKIDAFIQENYSMHADPSGYVFATLKGEVVEGK
ncbi:hypothetical protein [Pseudomonas piscis]